MRIVIDLQGAQSTGSRNRGIGRYSLSLSESIIKNKGNHEVLIVLNGLFADTVEEIKSHLGKILNPDNIFVWSGFGPVSHLNPDNKWRRKSAEISREAFLYSLRPDIVYVTSLFEGLTDDAITSIGLLSTKIPTAVTLYDLIPLINRGKYLENPVVESWYENKLDQIRRSSLLLAISESSRQEGIDHLGFPQERSINIGTAADSQFRKTTISEQTEIDIRKKYELVNPFIMYTGGIDHRKNIDGLIRSYALLPINVRLQHQLAIVCSVTKETKLVLANLAVKHGLRNNEVILTGFVPENELIALYHLCKAFIFPSWHEGFGLPALEAMCCGAAVIAANTSSLPEVVGLEAALFDPYDDQDMAKKIEEVLTNDLFRQQLVNHGQQQAKKFSWDESGKRAISAFEKLYSEENSVPTKPIRCTERQRLAYISPLPAEHTGIADYSAELLPHLSKYYAIDVITTQDTVENSWILENCEQRSLDWFSKNSHQYKRIIYHFGNSPYHQHMFDLLEKVPGVVVLHDFFLSGIVHYIEAHNASKDYWSRELYNSHGYHAVQELNNSKNVSDIVNKYPCTKSVLDASLGVITHSNTSKKLADIWFGKNYSSEWTSIPLLREINKTYNVPGAKKDARQSLFIEDDVFLVCSFGLLSPNKLNLRLAKAWLASSLSKDLKCRLVFVGKNHDGEYGRELELLISENKSLKHSISITGWTTATQFREYLIAADLSVQLRTQSRGETSAAVLDCMNYGIPTIVNANGSMAELPREAVFMLDDEFTDSDLVNALETLWKNKEYRFKIGQLGRNLVKSNHAPRICAASYMEAIEKYYLFDRTSINSLCEHVGTLNEEPSDQNQALNFLSSVSKNKLIKGKKQLLLDISVLVHSDAKSGIQRVVRSIISELLNNPPEGYRVEPVYANPEGPYRYARQFTLKFLKCSNINFSDDPIDVGNGDTFLCLDLTHHIAISQASYYLELQRIGINVNFVVYDLLPILMPHCFPEGVATLHERWMNVLATTSGIICISKAVADEALEWLSVFGPKRTQALNVGWLHLGADLEGSVPTKGLPPESLLVFQAMHDRPTFLSVGTIEPRKGQKQTLAAFDILWKSGKDIVLVFVGKNGWNVEDLTNKILNHQEFNSRLFWLDGVSDEYLEKVYANATCLIAASEGEGFGLPLIEAAQHKLPIIARGTPIFKEVAGVNAYYFDGLAPESLAKRILSWLALKKSEIPSSESMQWLTWKQCTKSLLDIVLNGNWYQKWRHDGIIRHWGSDMRLSSQVGMRSGRCIQSTGKAGYLLFGPYIPLERGNYRLTIKASSTDEKQKNIQVDVAADRGNVIFAKFGVNELSRDCNLVDTVITINSECNDLEIRVWIDEFTDLSISFLEIVPWKDIYEYKFQGSDNRFSTQVGLKSGGQIVSTGTSGYLLFGPYLALPQGKFKLSVTGKLSNNQANYGYIDAVVERGAKIVVREQPLVLDKVTSSMEFDIDLEAACSDFEVRVKVAKHHCTVISSIVLSPIIDSLHDSQGVLSGVEIPHNNNAGKSHHLANLPDFILANTIDTTASLEKKLNTSYSEANSNSINNKNKFLSSLESELLNSGENSGSPILAAPVIRSTKSITTERNRAKAERKKKR